MRLRSALTTRLNVLILVLSLTVAELPLAPSLPLLTGAGVLVLPRRRLRSGQQSDAHAVISGAVGDPQQRDQA